MKLIIFFHVKWLSTKRQDFFQILLKTAFSAVETEPEP
jgi:hypothetical protein